MAAIHSSGSRIERLLGSAMWRHGIRYRKQYRAAPGRPDFAIPWARTAVFCDSSFWHGRDWNEDRVTAFKTNREFWVGKIGRNIERDQEVNCLLRDAGWQVLRFWDNEIEADPDACALLVVEALRARRPGAL